MKTVILELHFEVTEKQARNIVKNGVGVDSTKPIDSIEFCGKHGYIKHGYIKDYYATKATK